MNRKGVVGGDGSHHRLASDGRRRGVSGGDRLERAGLRPRDQAGDGAGLGAHLDGATGVGGALLARGGAPGGELEGVASGAVGVEVHGQESRFQNAILNLKAVLHYMNEGLTGNSLYRWRDSL